jgi:membrane-bound lytic murein transglycosylase D
MQYCRFASLARTTAVVLALLPGLAAAAEEAPPAPVAVAEDPLLAPVVTAEALAPAPSSEILPPPAEPAAAEQAPVVAAPDLPAPPAALPPVLSPALPPADLWERIRRGFAIPDLTTQAAASRTQWYASKRQHIERVAQRASLYLYYIVEEIERRGMPTELALLPFIESAMQPEALSPARAAGLWQFIPSTGKLYALEQNLWRDERRDVLASTRAALDYLQKLYADFGDWQLALAAYNMGEGGLARSIERAQRAGKPTDYASLKLPNETMGYVPGLQAIENLISDPTRYGIALPMIRNEPYFVTLTKSRDIDVATVAQLAEMPLEEFRALNPSFNRPLIVGAAQPTLLLPAAQAETYLANLAAREASGQPLASWTTYTLAPGETLAQIAQRVGLAEAALREANRVPTRYRLAAGSTVLVPREQGSDADVAAEQLAAAFTLVPVQTQVRQVRYRGQRRDSSRQAAPRQSVATTDQIAGPRRSSRPPSASQKFTRTLARTGPTRSTNAAPAGKTVKTALSRAPATKKVGTAARPQPARIASSTRP